MIMLLRTRSLRARTAAAIGTAAAVTLVISGCQFNGVGSLPLPGGPSLGSHPYRVEVDFTNVLDLVPQSVVKVNDVTVGKVTSVQLQGWHARVTCMINGNVHLPSNAVAKISQTSLLGEKFVALSAPSGQSSIGTLSSGSLIPLTRSSEDVQVEQVLSALSMLVNNGGLEQLSTITNELNSALHGNEDTTRDLLKQLNTTVGAFNAQRGTIVQAINNLDSLTAKFAAQNTTIANSLDQITPALRLLADQRAQLTKLLTSTSQLATVADRVINASSADFLANLRALQPIADSLAQTGDQLPKSLEMILTFPFPPTTTNVIKGDYVNQSVTLDLNVGKVLQNLLGGTALSSLGGAASGSGRGTGLTPPLTTAPQAPLGALPGSSVPAGTGSSGAGGSPGSGGLGGLGGLLSGGLG
jgi:phospholipid/cholesterol/gamma-HCH transport system substrate-binding protein